MSMNSFVIILSFFAAIQITFQQSEEPETPSISETQDDFVRSFGTESSSNDNIVRRRTGKVSYGSSCSAPIPSCVPISECEELNEIRLQTTFEGMQTLRNYFCGRRGKTATVCCDDYLKGVSQSTTVKPLSNFKKCGDNVFNIKNSKPKITGDAEPALLGAWPWMVALYYTRIGQNEIAEPLCGGSLISNEWVLTAGHCLVEKKSSLQLAYVVLGDLDLDTTVADGAHPTKVKIAQVIRHPRYWKYLGATLNDIALLRLSKPVEYNMHIQPICLHRGSEYLNDDLFYKDRKPTVAGWGYTNDTERRSSSHLLQAEVPVVSIAKCKKNYAGIGFVKINETVMCAGKGGEDACRGDSGGPLMFKHYDDNMWYQGGIVSFGKSCGTKEYPGVYTRVAAFMNWIEETTNLEF